MNRPLIIAASLNAAVSVMWGVVIGLQLAMGHAAIAVAAGLVAALRVANAAVITWSAA